MLVDEGSGCPLDGYFRLDQSYLFLRLELCDLAYLAFEHHIYALLGFMKIGQQHRRYSTLNF